MLKYYLLSFFQVKNFALCLCFFHDLFQIIKTRRNRDIDFHFQSLSLLCIHILIFLIQFSSTCFWVQTRSLQAQALMLTTGRPYSHSNHNCSVLSLRTCYPLGTMLIPLTTGPRASGLELSATTRLTKE